ncbi:hypothetical protein OA7_0009285 [Vibrio cyclitrophicus 1F53]|uniref:hypothetical protein n=1 Tax=Vibrio cyclitrophicus TaxID=47951 RepID=UPI0002FA48B6|nr:hypothetical protein [Vibrio cyclitrophicus]OEF34494.1 hypothetical protein OA7_09015 [Vibrio cyclitrophicus 1F53]OEF66656.1 hypothetical protein OAA_20180 [Vibrio cyclitrophicus 1F175]PMH33193.1 hypothetical protein BCU72_01140 [Vibrio cyclitrophicus]PMH44684.1 hypothetical protein BCU67_07170 [Vibrio cyclitrophicus]
MYIIQVCSGVLPRYLSHYLLTEPELTPVITVSKSNALPMTKHDANFALNNLSRVWPLAKVIEA